VGPTPAGRENVAHHTFEIIEDVASSNPQSVKASFNKLAVADDISLGPVAHRMGFTIDLDRQPTLKAHKVSHIAVARELSTKAQTVLSLPQLLPKHDFRKRQLSAKLASEANIRVRRADRAVTDTPPFGPSTMLRMVPLPVPGRIFVPHHNRRIQEQTANVKR
jgi:hypothetical protein